MILLNNVKKILEEPNGVRRAAKAFSRKGYTIHAVRDYMKRGKIYNNNITGKRHTRKHQYSQQKSQKIINNLLRAGNNIGVIKGGK